VAALDGRSQRLQKILSRYVAVFQDSVEKADLYLLEGNRDVSVVTLKSHVTAFLPNCQEAEIVTEDFDEVLSVNRP